MSPKNGFKRKGFISGKIDSLFDGIIKWFYILSSFASKKVSEGALFLMEAKRKSKNLVLTNLEIADTHIQNNNLFDAKLRYYLILKLDPKNVAALTGLGYLYIIQNKKTKALVFMERALQNCQDEALKPEIIQVISGLKQ